MMKRDSVENFRDIFGTIGAIIAGIWAIHQYVMVDSSEAKLNFEQILSYGLQVDISASPQSIKKDHFIQGSINFSSISSQLLSVDLHKFPPLSAIRLASTDKSGRMVPSGPVIEQEFRRTNGSQRVAIDIVPGRKVTLPFIMKVQKPGAYLVQFLAPVHFPNKSAQTWGTSVIVIVQG